VISLLCPTRGRPDNVRRMLDSVLVLADGPVEVVFYVDDDDQPTIDLMVELANDSYPIVPVIGPRILMSEMWNRCAEHATYDILGLSDDDVVYRTNNWDTLIMDAFSQYPDNIVMVHGRDGIHDALFGTHPFIHRKWMETTGYYAPPYFSSDFNDTWLNDVANMLNRRHYIEALYTEHMHPVAGKAEWDNTYRERMNRHGRDNCDAIYQVKHDERVADAEKLGKVISEFVG
jgi:hypothetical protein